ncbi:unnamed protein product [Blepharisma stoltei]|uniref:Dickkopf N-terminal cysteine-rich domain-containing protein n=1 Tax=Blepharisma stoltei TaxID=1481888 RepID=A0AAU9K916_9CILI|nr:unnamed protein product [Blepharisma stoltei]
MANMIVIFLLLAIFPSIEALTCPKYQCKAKDYPFPDPSTCMSYDETNGIYYVNPCNYGYYCPAMLAEKSANCTRPLPSPPHAKLAGESCFYDEDCYLNNTCVNGYCKGHLENHSCLNHTDCDVGLRCHQDTCIAQIPAGEKGCIEDSDCVNNAGCDIVSSIDPTVNTCKTYFSISNEDPVNLNCTTAGDVNYLCKSGFCIELNKGDTPQCYTAPKSSKKIPTSCTADTDCVSKTIGKLNKSFNTDCLCSYTKAGGGVCDIFPGDSPYVKYSDIIKSWTKSKGILKCNTYARFSENCMDTWWEKKKIDELMYYDNYVFIYSVIHEAEDCVVQTYFPAYWEAKKEYDKGSDANGLIVGIFLVLGLGY